MATVDVGTLQAILRLRDEMSPQIEKTSRGLPALGKAFAAMAATATAAVVAVGAGLAVVAKRSIEAAAQAQETENLFTVSFGDMAEAARRWSEEVSDAVGSNEFALRENAATLFTMVENMGVARDEAFKMSTGLTELAGDMASFYNLPHEQAFAKIQAGISGESEPLKRLGILVTENTIKHTALRHGLIEAGEAMSEQVKVQARYIAIIEQTQKAQGDLENTLDSATNRQRVMAEQLDELQIKIGQALMPAYEAWLAVIAEVVQWLQRNEETLLSLIRNGLLGLSKGIEIVLVGFGLMNEGIRHVLIALTELDTGLRAAGAGFTFLRDVARDPLHAAAAFEVLKERVREAGEEGAKKAAAFNASAREIDKLILGVTKANAEFGHLVTAERETAQATETLSGQMGSLAETTAKATREQKELAKLLKEEAQASYDQLAKDLREFEDELASAAEAQRKADLAQLADEAAMSYQGMADELGEFEKQAVDLFGRLPEIVGSALQGGGDVMRSIGADWGAQLGQSLADRLGGTLSGLLPGLGSLFGGALGGIIGTALGFVSGLFTDAEVEVNDLRDAFFEAHGGFVAVQQALLGTVGAVEQQDYVKQIFDAETVEEFNAAVQNTLAVINQQEQAEQEVREAFDQVAAAGEDYTNTLMQQFSDLIAKIDELIANLQRIGQVPIPAINVPVTWDIPNIPAPGVPDFQHGSGGFRDFGRGTPAMLHGVERVQTSAQAAAEDQSAAELRKLRGDLADLPRAVGRSVRDAMALTGR